MTLAQALQFTVDDLQAKTLEELNELHSILSRSKQKKARLQADLVAGIMTAKKKAEAEAKATKTKKKVTAKKKATATATATAEAEAKAEAEANTTVENSVKPKKAVQKKKADKSLEEMTREELLAYVKQLQEQKAREVFPQVIEGEKVRFVQVKLETVHDIQNVLLDKPYRLYLFADERSNELTQFLVLFANEEIVVLLDRNQQRNSTVTIKTEQLKENYIVFEKEGKFAYRFYIREAKE